VETPDIPLHPLMEQLRTNLTAPPAVTGFFTCVSGDRLFYRAWVPSDPQKILVGVHGMGAHSEYYVVVADEFFQDDVATFAIDLKGHGRSTGRNGDIPSFKELVDQLREFVMLLREKQGDLPIYVMGISMGGTVAINYAIRYSDDCAGVLLLAPAVQLGGKVTVGDVVKFPFYAITHAIRPWARVVNIAQRQGLGIGTRNPLRQAYDDADELRLKRVSFRYVLHVAGGIRLAHMGVDLITCPVVILQGTADKIVFPAGVREFFVKLKTADKTLIELEGAYHTLFTDGAMVEQAGWSRLRDWLKTH